MQPAPLPAELTGRAFTTRQAAALGIGRARVRASDLVRPVRGVVVPAEHPTPLIAALGARMTEHEAFSGVTAAALLGWRLPPGMASAPVEIVARSPFRPPRIAGVRSGLVPSEARFLDIGGLQVLEPDWVLLTLARQLSAEQLVIVLDGLLARFGASTTVDELSRLVAAHRGRRGVGVLATALEAARPGTDSARETELRREIVRADLPEPRVNYPIRAGHRVYHGDLMYPKERLLVEYDGAQHRLDARQFSVDVRRLGDLAAHGVTVIRVDAVLFPQKDRWLRMIAHALEAAR